MIRVMALASVLLGLATPVPHGRAVEPSQDPAAPPPSLAEMGEIARGAWEGRDLDGFLAPALGRRLVVTVPPGNQSAPIAPGQARALLLSYVQGTQEVTTLLAAAKVVDSLQGYVELSRRYRLVGIPADRRATILLGYRRGRADWVLTEVRIAP